MLLESQGNIHCNICAICLNANDLLQNSATAMLATVNQHNCAAAVAKTLVSMEQSYVSAAFFRMLTKERLQRHQAEMLLSEGMHHNIRTKHVENTKVSAGLDMHTQDALYPAVQHARALCWTERLVEINFWMV